MRVRGRFAMSRWLIGLVTVALGMQIGRRWYGFWAGLTAGVLLAISPLLWEYSQEVRAYVVVPLIALAQLIVADRILRAKREEAVPRHVWLVAFAVQLIGLYTHNLSVPLIVWLNIALGLMWLLRLDWRKMFVWAGVEIALIAAYVPWLLTQSPSGTPLNSPPQPGLALVRDIWASYFLPVIAQLRDISVAITVIDVAGVLALVMVVFSGFLLWRAAYMLPLHNHQTHRRGDIHVARDKLTKNTADAPLRVPTRTPEIIRRDTLLRVRFWLLLGHALLVPIFSTLLIAVAHIDFHPRYYIASVAGTLLLIVAAISHLPWRRSLYVATSTIAVIIAGLSLHQITTIRSYQHDDFRGLAEYYATLPEDAVILIPFDAERALQDYYADVLDIQAQFVNVPLYTDDETALAIINDLAADGTRHVEFLTWFQLPADARGMYPCLLTAAHRGELDEPQFYFGLSTQRYDIQPIEFIPLAVEPTYRVVDFIEADYATSQAGTCIRTRWKHALHFQDNLNVSASVQNPIQQPIARSDTEIARPDNVGTSLWDEGDQGTAYNLLRLPDGAPKVEYGVTFGVYASIFPVGFDLLDEAGNPSGKTFGTTSITQGADLPVTQPTLQATSSDQIETGIPFDVTLNVPPDAQEGRFSRRRLAA